MRLLIAYDGSQCSEEALSDLSYAGLPRRVEALVLSMADVFLPPGETLVDPGIPRRYSHQIRRAHLAAKQAVDASYGFASKACERLKASYPDWNILAEACADEPGWGVIKKADTWKPDLIVVGSHNYPLWKRLWGGSVSQKVLKNTDCTVRIGRTNRERCLPTLCLVVGIDGSPDAEETVNTILKREWPKNVVVHLIAVVEPKKMPSKLSPPTLVSKAPWIRKNGSDPEAFIHQIIRTQEDELRRKGLAAFSCILKEGDPASVLIKEAKRLTADCIFLGSRGIGATGRRLGHVSRIVAATAQCSVEIIRVVEAQRKQ